VGEGAHVAHGDIRRGDFFVFLSVDEVFGLGSGAEP
jgi:hypothetical protein